MTLLDDALAVRARAAYGCDHSGLHTPVARYSQTDSQIVYVTVCDDCGADQREIAREDYVPKFDPTGNDPYLTVAVAG